MKILVGIPCLSGYGHTKEAIDSVLSQSNVDLLLIDNGADEDVKNLFLLYSQDTRVTIIHNANNIYVNPAWNQIVKYFLDNIGYDYLVIMNSDLLMNKNWARVLFNRFITCSNESYLPVVIDDKTLVHKDVNVVSSVCQEINGGAPGVFITLTKTQARLIFPITEDCLVWYGDNWVYDILRGCGHKIIIIDNLIAHHGLSQTVSRVAGIDELIGADHKKWRELVSGKIQEVIERNKGI